MEADDWVFVSIGLLIIAGLIFFWPIILGIVIGPSAIHVNMQFELVRFILAGIFAAAGLIIFWLTPSGREATRRYERRQARAEYLRRSQCYYCGGSTGSYYLTCSHCNAVLCSQRCYDNHYYSSHK